MLILLSFNSGTLIAALLIGFCMGWIAVVYRGPSIPTRTAPWIVLGLSALLLLSLFHVVSGRAGYWLDLGLVIFAVYVVGCMIGSWLRDRVVFGRRRPLE